MDWDKLINEGNFTSQQRAAFGNEAAFCNFDDLGKLRVTNLTPMMKAAAKGNWNEFHRCLKEAFYDDKELYTATVEGDDVTMYERYAAIINRADSLGNTILHYLAVRISLASTQREQTIISDFMLRLVGAYGADPSQPNYVGDTPASILENAMKEIKNRKNRQNRKRPPRGRNPGSSPTP